MTWLMQWLPRTTVGRFWGYVGVALALIVSLAGNVESAKLHTPFIEPSDVEYAFAGIPPLVAFISIEIVNHNPWANIEWGKWITRVLLFVVAPGSALVSFAHLTLVGLHALQVPVPDDLQTFLNVATAILTALLIDGLILGGTAALLLPKKKEVPSRGLEVESGYDKIRDEARRMVDDLQTEFDRQREEAFAAIRHLQEELKQARERPVDPPKSPVKRSVRKTQVPQDRPSHPAWSKWVDFKVEEGREPTGKEMAALAGVSEGAARALMARWRRALPVQSEFDLEPSSVG